jgi:hypothetical protein
MQVFPDQVALQIYVLNNLSFPTGLRSFTLFKEVLPEMEEAKLTKHKEEYLEELP